MINIYVYNIFVIDLSLNEIKKDKIISKFTCSAILGVFRLYSTSYLLLVSEVEYIGNLLNSNIYTIKKICCTRIEVIL